MPRLSEYQRKRSFDTTPEPQGDSKSTRPELHFVVQKHRARRLHYDLRLQLGDVLKSWAVPKGPSLDPQEKRLALMVEDHPLDYEDFEGVIPEGNYGAGEVLVWDRGSYQAAGARTREQSEKALTKGLAEGHISFILAGKKLKGEFALVHLKRADDPNAWLLIKANDRYVSGKEILEEERSVLSGRNLHEIANSAPAEGRYWASAAGRSN